MATYRNRRLLDLAHEPDAPCCADFPHDCNAHKGCEPAHADSQLFGRGHGHKSHDCFFAILCHNAHMMITAKVNDENEREQKFYDWLRSHVKSQVWLWQNRKVRVA